MSDDPSDKATTPMTATMPTRTTSESPLPTTTYGNEAAGSSGGSTRSGIATLDQQGLNGEHSTIGRTLHVDKVPTKGSSDSGSSWWNGKRVSVAIVVAAAAGVTVTATWLGWKHRKRVGQYLYTLWYGSEERLHKDHINQCLDIVERNIDSIEEEFSQVFNQLKSLLHEATEKADEQTAVDYKRQIQALLLKLNEGKNEAESVLANLDQVRTNATALPRRVIHEYSISF